MLSFINNRSSIASVFARRCTAAIAALACAGCATTGPSLYHDVDRFERVNRAVYRFNQAVDRRIIRPVAKGYEHVVPHPVERRVRNFFVNLRAPVDIVNSVLQGKFRAGFSDLGRFVFDSTVGLAGFFDPAGKLGLERHAEDFGQTLAVWRVPSGPYLVLPLLGPGSFRDWGGWLVDFRTDPVLRHADSSVGTGLFAWRLVSDRAALLPAQRTLDEAFDEYSLVRAAYIQRRVYEIYDGSPPEDDSLYLDPDP